MFNTYDDITSRIAEQPLWYDEYSVPRYGPFSPDGSASIYISEVVLMEIALPGLRPCLPSCAMLAVNFSGQTMAEAIRLRTLHYGDPPNVECCLGGPTMNSVPRRVLEYWHRCHPQYLDGRRITDMAYFDWKRDASLEIEFERED